MSVQICVHISVRLSDPERSKEWQDYRSFWNFSRIALPVNWLPWPTKTVRGRRARSLLDAALDEVHIGGEHGVAGFAFADEAAVEQVGCYDVAIAEHEEIEPSVRPGV